MPGNRSARPLLKGQKYQPAAIATSNKATLATISFFFTAAILREGTWVGLGAVSHLFIVCEARGRSLTAGSVRSITKRRTCRLCQIRPLCLPPECGQFV